MTSSFVPDFRFVETAAAAALPFISFLLIMIFARNHPRFSASLSIVAVGLSMALALALLAGNWHLEKHVQYAGKWLLPGGFSITLGFLLDPLSLLMFALVAVISFLVQVYSLGYMSGDPGFARYYAFQSLFAWAMLSLTLSSSLLQLYVFWELVGLSSYLLIGFWYEKFSASQAGKKAFVMTRLGDIGLLLGLLLILIHFGNMDILELSSPGLRSQVSSGFATLVALLIFCAIIGKSAQFPLLTWLPDAMEGPTPVSALLHSATMVAAGVYLFARLFPFFSLSPEAMTVFLAIGTISMLLASTMAMVQRDIKQVWAYSTISQLGFMIMALGAGSLFAGFSHLTTHAFFKAMLFLCSGVWIHRYKTNDVFEIGRHGGRGIKAVTVCLIVASAALSGLPPMSGFFSKEAIMSALAALDNPIWLSAGLLGVFLTAYYTFRMVFILLFPPRLSESEGHEEGSYWVMAGPILVLAGVTVVLGFFLPALRKFLQPLEGVAVSEARWVGLLPFTLGTALFGVLLSWFEFGRRGATQVGFVERIPPLRDLFANRWYIDEFYLWVVRVVVDRFLSRLSERNESRVINEGIDRFCGLTLEGGRATTRLQSGILRYNLLFMLGVLVFAAFFVLLP